MSKNGLETSLANKAACTICTLSGEVSYETVLILRNIFDEIRKASPANLILDLSRLDELGSAGLGEMARLILWCESKSCRLSMVTQADHIQEILTISGLDKYASIFHSLKDAQAATNP